MVRGNDTDVRSPVRECVRVCVRKMPSTTFAPMGTRAHAQKRSDVHNVVAPCGDPVHSSQVHGDGGGGGGACFEYMRSVILAKHTDERVRAKNEWKIARECVGGTGRVVLLICVWVDVLRMNARGAFIRAEYFVISQNMICRMWQWFTLSPESFPSCCVSCNMILLINPEDTHSEVSYAFTPERAFINSPRPSS